MFYQFQPAVPHVFLISRVTDAWLIFLFTLFMSYCLVLVLSSSIIDL